jgi:[ribosomal protein S5]-alanine N-acetyltransferase
MDLILVPINEHLEQNEKHLANPHCVESLDMTCEFYKRVGFFPPWVGYYARRGDELLGCAAVVGQPINGIVEIAYATFEKYQRRGVATAICKILVDLALKTDSTLRVTAHTRQLVINLMQHETNLSSSDIYIFY